MGFQLFDLSGKRALVTGSSQGIGLALAQGLAAAGVPKRWPLTRRTTWPRARR